MKKWLIVLIIVIIVIISIIVYFSRGLSKEYDEDYIKQIVFDTGLAKCVGFTTGTPKLDGPIWIFETNSNIEDLKFFINKNTGKIVEVKRQVFDTQCLFSDSQTEKVVFCCDCLNHNPICEIEIERDEVIFTGNDIVNQIKEFLGDLAEDIPSPGECEKVSNMLHRHTCYLNLAISKEDISICDNIQGEVFKDACYRVVAIDKKDSSLCEKITTEVLKDNCKTSISS